ncbi:MAG: hypothetical protein ACU0BF_09200 [Paracoccaceae bacterium]
MSVTTPDPARQARAAEAHAQASKVVVGEAAMADLITFGLASPEAMNMLVEAAATVAVIRAQRYGEPIETSRGRFLAVLAINDTAFAEARS